MKKIKHGIIYLRNIKKACIMWVSFFFKKPRIASSYIFIWIRSIIYPENRYPLPWMTFGAIDWLKKNATKKYKVFEWGSGGSSLYWAKNVEYVCSVEHNAQWYNQVAKLLAGSGFNNYDYKLMQPKYDDDKDNKISDFTEKNFEMYCRTIESFPDNYFDLIIIDGEARLDCARLAMEKIKDSGHIILDNAERKEYLPIFDMMKDWKKTVFRGPGLYNLYSWDTAIFSRK